VELDMLGCVVMPGREEFDRCYDEVMRAAILRAKGASFFRRMDARAREIGRESESAGAR
jgi:hypothetical protein